MNKTFTKFKGSILAGAALAALSTAPAFAQLNYRATSSTNLVTTYTDLGTTGTAITVANNDDANSAAIPIGFTFNYNGQAFTSFILNTNGFIKLGTTAPATGAIAFATDIFDVTDQNIIAPATGVDLKGAANQTANPTEFRVATTGTAPNRVTTIQWENLEDVATPASSANAQFTAIQFQVKLYETTNVIDFVYGTWTSNGAVPTSGQPFIVALKGSSSALADRLLVTKPSSGTPWTGTSIVFTPGTTVDPARHFIRNTFGPDAGRTYRFTPVVIPANDMAVLALFVQGKVAKNGGTPQVIKALVKNTGSAAITNRTISLNISGANTFTSSVTLGTLAVGEDSLISFAPFAPANLGSNNFVEVTAPTDGDNTNNTAESNIVVTAGTQGYAQYPTTANALPLIQTALSGVYPATAPAPATRNANFLVKFTSTGRTRVTTVRAYVPGAAFNPVVNTIGATVYGVVFNSAGVEVGRSANVVLTAADVDKFVTFTLTTPATFNANEVYYVGMGLPAQSVPATAATIYAMGVQNEQNTAIRPGVFYVSPVSTTASVPVDFADDLRFVIEADIVDVTGIKEELNAKLVSVYPNPSNGTFKLSASAMKGGNNVALEVRDMQGKLVYSANAAKTDATLKLNNLASGVYMLHVTSDAEVAVKRLVIE